MGLNRLHERIKEPKNRMRSLRSLFGGPLDRTNGETVEAVGVVRAVAARAEVEAPGVEGIARVRNGRPVVAVRTGIVEEGSPAAVAGGG